MPTLNELLQAKVDRLETVPDAFLTSMQKVQKELFASVLEILSTLNVDANGFLEITVENVDKVAMIDVRLREALELSEYTEVVTDFAKEFNTQIVFNDEYFGAALKGFERSEIGEKIVKMAQKNAVELLVKMSPDAYYILPIKQAIENAVINGARWRDTLDVIQTIAVGNDEVEGKIMHYSKQIAHDSFAVADRSYSSAAAEQVGADWFKWSGSVIKTTRPFCEERHNKFFCKKEFEMWGAGKTTEGFAWPQSGAWAGEFPGTDASSIFSLAGGITCRHSVMAVSISAVPIAQIKRAMELGYYEPTPFEVEELGL